MTQALVELRSAVRPHLSALSAGDRILVAVSGGADSLSLAGALLAESKELLITCIGVTIDHQLQDGSKICDTLAIALSGSLTGPLETNPLNVLKRRC